jgi:hypothetical protein
LFAIDGAEVTPLVGPLVPDAHAVRLEVADIGVAGQEPQQLMDDRLEVKLLGGQQREARGEIEAHLVAEHAQGAGAGAVGLSDAIVARPVEQIEILAHGAYPLRILPPV